MILVRAPLRISFIGGGTDLPDFYKKHGGCVVSTTINQYVYLAIKHTPLVNKVIVKYSTTETVDHPKDLIHNRVREILLTLGINNNIEIGSFASIPARTGLGSSSSFTVALLKGLHLLNGKKINKQSLAEKACTVEIDLVKEPIGKQDQYAASYGGLNIYKFKKSGKVAIEPLAISKKNKDKFEKSLLLFFTGITRDASSVLSNQTKNIDKKIDGYKEIASLVSHFSEAIKKGDFKKAGDILHKSWTLKKTFADEISNSTIDDLYSLGIKNGAWGGKVLGAGGGGCVLFLAPENKHKDIRRSVIDYANKNRLNNFAEIEVGFDNKGVEIVFDQEKA